MVLLLVPELVLGVVSTHFHKQISEALSQSGIIGGSIAYYSLPVILWGSFHYSTSVHDPTFSG
jgi:hypothetical protein